MAFSSLPDNIQAIKLIHDALKVWFFKYPVTNFLFLLNCLPQILLNLFLKIQLFNKKICLSINTSFLKLILIVMTFVDCLFILLKFRPSLKKYLFAVTRPTHKICPYSNFFFMVWIKKIFFF
jgi:hypothetical protein